MHFLKVMDLSEAFEFYVSIEKIRWTFIYSVLFVFTVYYVVNIVMCYFKMNELHILYKMVKVSLNLFPL